MFLLPFFSRMSQRRNLWALPPPWPVNAGAAFPKLIHSPLTATTHPRPPTTQPHLPHLSPPPPGPPPTPRTPPPPHQTTPHSPPPCPPPHPFAVPSRRLERLLFFRSAFRVLLTVSCPDQGTPPLETVCWTLSFSPFCCCFLFFFFSPQIARGRVLVPSFLRTATEGILSPRSAFELTIFIPPFFAGTFASSAASPRFSPPLGW